MDTSNVSIHANNSNVNTGHGHPQPTDVVKLAASLARIRFTQNDLCDTFECMMSMYLDRVEKDFHKKPKDVPFCDILAQCEYLRVIVTNAVTQSVFTKSGIIELSQNQQEVANG